MSRYISFIEISILAIIALCGAYAVFGDNVNGRIFGAFTVLGFIECQALDAWRNYRKASK